MGCSQVTLCILLRSFYTITAGLGELCNLLLLKIHSHVLENLISSLPLYRKYFCGKSQSIPCLENKTRKVLSFPLFPKKVYFLRTCISHSKVSGPSPSSGSTSLAPLLDYL